MACDIDTHVGVASEATLSRDLLRAAWLLPGWDEGARVCAARTLSELCAARCEVTLRGPHALAADDGRDPHGYVVSLVARETQTTCAWLELEGDLARAIVDLALGGTAETAELAFTEPLDATRQGVLLYLVASVLASIGQDALAIAGLAPAHAVPRPTRVACAARLSTQGRSYGARLSVAPALLGPAVRASAAVDGRALPGWAREHACVASVELAHGSLPGDELAALQAGDVLVPTHAWADAGAWSTATLRCDAFDEPVASLHVDANGTLQTAPPRPRPPTSSPASQPGADWTDFSVVAARVSVSLGDLFRWLSEGRVPLAVDPAAPLTLFVADRPVAQGLLVRDRANVGLCVARVL
ncbi:MAG: hypothetical protein KC593_20135 [Myxococcales bacterium]|nr:hypothetical protein [Myxococcales bacterium]